MQHLDKLVKEEIENETKIVKNKLNNINNNNNNNENIDNEEKNTPVFQKIKKDIQTYTNFSEEKILSLYRRCEPEFALNRRRGRAPKISNFDSIVLLLIFYKLNTQYDELAAIFDLTASTLHDALARARPVLNSALIKSWWTTRKRPTRIGGRFNNIALLIDSSSFEVYRPKGTFGEVKVYFDYKNGIYALKKEFAVMAAPPHYAMFSSPGFVGSIHDYEHFKGHHFI
jgi:hypothetical protein